MKQSEGKSEMLTRSGGHVSESLSQVFFATGVQNDLHVSIRATHSDIHTCVSVPVQSRRNRLVDIEQGVVCILIQRPLSQREAGNLLAVAHHQWLVPRERTKVSGETKSELKKHKMCVEVQFVFCKPG